MSDQPQPITTIQVVTHREMIKFQGKDLRATSIDGLLTITESGSYIAQFIDWAGWFSVGHLEPLLA